MPLSAWLRFLATLLGPTKSKPSDIKRAELATKIAEAVESTINVPKQRPPS